MRETIWFRNYRLDEVEPLCRGNMAAHLGIKLTELCDDCLIGSMPVDQRTTQPAGLLHGGASVVLAESLGSIAANLCVDPDRWTCVGQEVSASHLRPVRKGLVTGIARPIHRGRSAQTWEINVVDERRRKVCVVRLTVAVVAARHGGRRVEAFDK
jgi:1,4-dihydroxy-2-naphthoyl-CoA hydrolase